MVSNNSMRSIDRIISPSAIIIIAALRRDIDYHNLRLHYNHNVDESSNLRHNMKYLRSS